jgi:hypothetical protein
MKKIFLLSSIIAVLLSSCETEKEDSIKPTAQTAQVIGKWSAIERHYYYYDSLNQPIGQVLRGWGSHFIEFIPPATLNETLPQTNKVITGNFVLNNNQVSVNFPQGVLENESVFIEQDSILSKTPFLIDSLTTTRLILRDTVVLTGSRVRYRVSITTLKR